MLSEKFRASLLDFMLGLGLKNLDAYENVIVKSTSNKKDVCAALVCLSDSMVYIFMQTALDTEPTDADKSALIGSLNICETAFASHLEIQSGKIQIFAVNESSDEDAVIYHRRPYSDSLVLLNDKERGAMGALRDLIETQELYFQRSAYPDSVHSRGLSPTNESFFKTLSTKLEFASRDGEKIKYDSDGHAYIRKRNNSWVRASDIDGKKLLFLATLGGSLGLHLFYQGRKAKGVLYLLTCGLFGVGWIFDAIELLLGVYKDKDGYYIIPPQVNFILTFLTFAAGLVLTFGIGVLYRIILSYGNDLLKNVSETALSEWSSSQ